MYKHISIKTDTIDINVIIRLSDNAYIPLDPSNTDYQLYLEWLAEGNEPEFVNS